MFFENLHIGEFVKLVHLVSVQVELAVVALDAPVSAAVWNEDGSVALVEGAEHGVMHASGCDQTATDDRSDSFGTEYVIKFCVIEAGPSPLFNDCLSGNFFGEVRWLDVVDLYWQVWVQLIELGEEGRTRVGVVGSNVNDFEMLWSASCDQLN